MDENLYIGSSAAEYLIFSSQAGENGIEVRFEDGTAWLTQKAMAELFGVDRSVIGKHLKNVFAEGELEEKVVCALFAHTTQHGAIEGKTQVHRAKYYNLDAIISVGYRVNSKRATQFRRWATNVLREFTLKGYIIDRKRMENGAYLSEDYFEALLEEIREIRLSERLFYQKITDIYATSMDYDRNSPITREFFAKVQNKMHYAVSQQTAAEIIYNRADSKKKHMGLTSWKHAPDGRVLKSDVRIAKNYLSKAEMEDLERIVSAFLDLAEGRAKRHIPMTMEDWAERIDRFLLADDRDILKDAGSISREIALEHAETEFEKYRIVQDRLYQSDFDELLLSASKE